MLLLPLLLPLLMPPLLLPPLLLPLLLSLLELRNPPKVRIKRLLIEFGS